MWAQRRVGATVSVGTVRWDVIERRVKYQILYQYYTMYIVLLLYEKRFDEHTRSNVISGSS